jgi:hypothetical protein
MASPVQEHNQNLTNLQVELLKSLKHTVSDKQLREIKSLLRFYFAEQLDRAIEKVENEKNYSAAVYDSWLKNNNGNQQLEAGI